MILVKSEIENVKVTVEIDENGDHRKWSGCPELKCEGNSHYENLVFEAVDVLEVVKAVKTCNTLEEFVEAVKDTWKKESLAEPIKYALNRKALENVKNQVFDILEVAMTDEGKELFEFNSKNRSSLNNSLNYYANEYDGRFDKLGETEGVKYLVQSVLADC